MPSSKETKETKHGGHTESQTTVDHEIIRKWAEARGGHPVTVKSTKKGGEPGLLRIDFPEYNEGGEFEEIGWEAFFEKFEKEHLAFIYQDKTKEGKVSRFCKFVERGHAAKK